MATQIFAAESLVYCASRMADQGMDVRKESLVVKYCATEMVNMVADKSIQIHGRQAVRKTWESKESVEW
jgi:alkylation response protein AidB-like acyl-CoA dehydrogenase